MNNVCQRLLLGTALGLATIAFGAPTFAANPVDVTCNQDDAKHPGNRKAVCIPELDPGGGSDIQFKVENCRATAVTATLKSGGAPLTCLPPTVNGTDSSFRCTRPPVAQVPELTDVSLTVQCTPGANPLRLTAPVKAAVPAPNTRANNDDKDRGNDDGTQSLSHLSDATWTTVMRELRIPLAGLKPGNYYDRADDRAVLFFDADGHAYYPIPDIIDEDDDIYVVVVDRRVRLQNLKLTTEGCKRPPATERVFGTGGGMRAAKQPSDVVFMIRTLGTCAGAESGGPKLKFSLGGADQTQIIPVNQVYRLAVGVAAAYDHTLQRDYAINTLPGETVSRVAEVHDHIGLTSLTYISFYPIARDYRKRDFFLPQRFQLFVGLDPRAFDKHLVVGAGYELTAGLNLLVGWRIVTKQKVLIEGSGLQLGDPYDGKPSALPTRERWEGGSFFIGAGLSSSMLSRLQ